MKFPLLLGVCAVIAAVVLFAAATPKCALPGMFHGGSAITVSTARNAPDFGPSEFSRPAASPAVITAGRRIPAYVQNLLRPLDESSSTSVAAVIAEPERRIMLPAIPLFQYLGLNVALGGFYQKAHVRSFQHSVDTKVSPVEKTMAGIEIVLGNSAPLSIRISGWLGLAGNCAQPANGSGVEKSQSIIEPQG